MPSVESKLFDYGYKEMDYLKNADAALGQVIEQMGKVERTVIPDLFAALVFAIVGQLISVKAADAIWHRLQEQLGEISPQNIAARTADVVQACGLTRKKTLCIKHIAQMILSGELDMTALQGLPDEEVIRKLTAIDGIGRWTAEMLLINAMERPDVMSWGDVAIRRGLRKLHGLEEITKQQFEKYRCLYSPYASVASIYLWKLSFETDEPPKASTKEQRG